VLCCVVLCCVVLCCVVLCCVVLCCVVLCCVVLFCVVCGGLCCVVLCCVGGLYCFVWFILLLLGVSWAMASASAPFQVRAHGNMVATTTGVLIVTGGDYGLYQTDDLWVSLDGGLTWGSCVLNNTEPFPKRKEAAVFIDSAGYLYVSSGLNQAAAPTAANPSAQLYTAYADFWKSSFSFNDIVSVTQTCGLPLPACNTGLQCWPPGSSCACTSGTFYPLTRTAIWEARQLPGFTITVNPISYTSVSGVPETLPVGSFIMYGGQK